MILSNERNSIMYFRNTSTFRNLYTICTFKTSTSKRKTYKMALHLGYSRSFHLQSFDWIQSNIS